MPYVSVKDVAARVGVSFQTVSKVLNGKGSVSAQTRAEILAAAEELGYVPNAVARSMVAQNTYTLGILASDLSDPVLGQFVVGAERAAHQHGHVTLVCTVDLAGSNAIGCLRLLIERRVDGMLLAAPQMENDPLIGPLLRNRVPAVGIHNIVGNGISLVGSDQVQVGELATTHLLELGHRRIGTIIGVKTRRVTHSRLRGYRQALQNAGIGFDQGLVEEGNWQIDGAYEATHRLLTRRPDVTGMFVQNDTMAIGALSALHEAGRRVPDDCAVVGCDDMPYAARTIPPLTTVHIPFSETGEAAVRLLLDGIADRGADPQHVLLPVSLVRRGSSGGNVRGSPPGR